MKIVADQDIPFVHDYFGACGELVLKPGRAMVADVVKSADMLLVRSVTQVDEALLTGSNVRFVGSVTAGADHLDTAWLDTAGIVWRTAHGFNAPPVADYVVSSVAALERTNILGADRKKAAVIGMGCVGQLVAARLRALNFEVIYCDPLRAENESDFVSVPLSDIAEADLITLHVPLTRTGAHPTHHFIDKAFLQRQKSGAVLLNAGRGNVIHQADLKAYGKHLFWCFDVWAHEPMIDKEILHRTMIATPHIAGYSVQSKMRGIEMIYQAACAAGMIASQQRVLLAMPRQTLQFSEDTRHWRDVVLGVFNPMVTTVMMRASLFPAEDYGVLFDEMRHAFNHRHEFAYTDVTGVDVDQQDAAILRQLGLMVA